MAVSAAALAASPQACSETRGERRGGARSPRSNRLKSTSFMLVGDGSMTNEKFEQDCQKIRLGHSLIENCRCVRRRVGCVGARRGLRRKERSISNKRV